MTALKALLKIKPPPSSSVYSTAILSRLKTFGEVTSFRRVQAKEDDSYEVQFEREDDLSAAVKASPLTVHVTPYHPDPHKEDRFNALGFRQRQHLPSCEFTVQLRQDHKAGQTVEPKKQRLVSHDGTEALRHSFIEAGAPRNLREGLAMRPEVVDDEITLKKT